MDLANSFLFEVKEKKTERSDSERTNKPSQQKEGMEEGNGS